MKTVSILGCGWLGLALAKSLKKEGFAVKGSTTNSDKLDELKGNGIEPYMISVDPVFDYDPVKGFFETDVLVINIPPPRLKDVVSYHSAQIGCIAEAIRSAGIKKVIFVSSTSVYPNINRIVTEDDDLEPEKSSGKALKTVESFLTGSPDFKTTVIRFSGLIGYDRNPREFLKRRKPRARSNAPVNLIHRDDCVEIIKKVIKKDIWGVIMNASSDENPMRREFYRSEARAGGIDPGNYFSEEKSDYKIVSNAKLKRILEYSFIYPDPLNIDR